MTSQREEPTPRPTGEDTYFRLRLFVAGDETNSRQAKMILSQVCRERLKGRCCLEVVDVLEDYQAALRHRVWAVPTLIIEAPPPRRTIIGSLHDVGKLLEMLGLPAQE